MFLLVGAAAATVMATSVLARKLWPCRRHVSMLLVGQLILGAMALVLRASDDRAVRGLTITCLAGAGLCLGGRIVRGVPTWLSRWRSWRTLRRGRRQTSQVYVWADALGLGVVASAFPWADGRQATVAVLAFVCSGVAPGVVQSARLNHRKYGLP